MGANYGGIPYIDNMEYLYDYNNEDRYDRMMGIYKSKWSFRFLFDMIFFNLNIKGKEC